MIFSIGKSLFKKSGMWFLFLFLLNNQFCYLIPLSFSIFGITFDDFVFLLIIILLFKSAIHDNWFNYRRFKFNYYIIIGFLIFITSIFIGYFNYNQPLIMGFVGLRRIIIWLLMYFYFRSLVIKNNISLNQLINLLYVYGICILLVSTIQYMLPSNLFVEVGQRERFDEFAYFYPYSTISLLFSISFYRLLVTQRKFELIISIWSVFFFIIILKVRMISIVVVIEILGLLILFSQTKLKSNRFWKFVLFVFFISFVYVFINSAIGDNIYENLTRSKDANMQIRDVGREFYLLKIYQNPIFGMGYPNLNWADAAKGSGQLDGIAMSDNGVIGTTAYFGLISLLWLISFFVFLWGICWKFYKRKGNFMFFGYLLFNLVASITLPPDLFSNAIGFQFFLVLLESYIDESKKNKECKNLRFS